MDEFDIEKSIIRISHEIIENNRNLKDIAVVGIHNRGVPLANRICKNIKQLDGSSPNFGFLDITFHRDDFRNRLIVPEVKSSNIDFSVTDKTVILVDDVLYTGRTTRAAIEELSSFGRVASIQLSVLIDRGHRELPIRADYVGKNIPTHEGEHVKVLLKEIDGDDKVYLIKE